MNVFFAFMVSLLTVRIVLYSLLRTKGLLEFSDKPIKETDVIYFFIEETVFSLLVLYYIIGMRVDREDRYLSHLTCGRANSNSTGFEIHTDESSEYGNGDDDGGNGDPEEGD